MRELIALLALCALTACGGQGLQQNPLPEPQRSAAAYVHDGPPSITLVTVISNRTGSGGHSALLVSGSQRVIFDPAGSFRHSRVTEHGDVLYGITPRLFDVYRSAHARSAYHVVSQEIVVSPQVAEAALNLVESRGVVASALCSQSTSSILAQLPGFESIRPTFFPRNLMEQFDALPGVTTEKLFENDEGDVVDGINLVGLTQ